MKRGFIIMSPIFGGEDEPAWWTTDESGKRVPVLYETEVAAWKEIADDRMEMYRQFRDGERELEDTDFDFADGGDYVIEVEIDEDGSYYDVVNEMEVYIPQEEPEK